MRLRRDVYKRQPLERSSYSLSDCVPADAPRDIQQAANLIKKEVGLPEAKNDCIVWATYDRTKTPDAATVYSSLHFEPTDNVLWQFTFQQQLYDCLLYTSYLACYAMQLSH